MLHAAFVRSPFPTPTSRGSTAPTPSWFRGCTSSSPPTTWPAWRPTWRRSGRPTCCCRRSGALARDEVRLVGDPVAVVLAESRAAAEDGAEAVVVDYVPRPGVGDDGRRCWRAPPSPSSPSSAPTWCTARGTATATPTAAFAAADRVVRARFDQHRHANVPMECRGIVADHDPATGALDVHTSPPVAPRPALPPGRRARRAGPRGAGAVRRHRRLVRPEERAEPARTWPSPAPPLLAGSPGEVDRGPQREPHGRRPGPRGARRRRGGRRRRRSRPRPPPAAGARPGRLSRARATRPPATRRSIRALFPAAYRIDAPGGGVGHRRPPTRPPTSPTGGRGRSRPGCASASSTWSPVSSASTRSSSGSGTCCVPTSCPGRARPGVGPRGVRPPPHVRRRRSPSSTSLPSGSSRPPPGARAACSASASSTWSSPPRSRPAW